MGRGEVKGKMMKELVGKKINGIYVSEGENELAFDTDAGVIGYEGYGDCCSETWFADVLGVSALIGATVAAVEDVDLENYNIEDGRGRQEADSVYGYKLRTDKGYADIVFRNSSNGYYGGSCDHMRNAPALESMRQITDDWHA